MKYVDFNTLSEMGLVWRINREILHPLGLALSRDVETGSSPGALIADDGVWHFDEFTNERNAEKFSKVLDLHQSGNLLDYLQKNAK
ncbi:hypothetical protein POFPNCPI_00226 [Klebsiella phage vB_KpM-Mild]|jgi:hypothetical protein|uniref:Phage protein n=2 Tax=Klebsiella virus PMBT1 TaxID=2560544 RepID=A0A1G4GQD5_9CAUD|nr:Phage protein [Klebsiella phage PMBT1]QQO91580.1 hypothetical protein vBKpnMM1_gp181c [Klebsiella phage vB_KpnM_M1]QYC51309.1 hypothetical protein [Klebsiella phage vB_KpnM-VAC66]UJP30867.1 hypothetical protein phKl35c1_240 [Klebsiella phage Kpn35c1]UQJ95576.1 hypothetical protein ALHIDCOG_00188 [Klebsiella phage CPRSB]CAD5242666.1 hypothetical protein POFPNCPI_00226 [Klebsiella phage vB_KpM-Mild]CAD5243058.1 hypothetical protein GCLPFEGH_00260 [Klebsiella phage vB_KpM-KalD]BEH83448.1 hyp